MRRRSAVTMMIMALPVTLVACGGSGMDAGSAERLEAAIEAFYQTVATDDIEGRLDLFDEDAVMMPDGGGLIRGHEAIAGVLRSGEGYQFRIEELERLELCVDDEIAFTANAYVYSWEPAGEEPVWHPTRNVHVWKKQADGTWKLHLDLWQNGAVPADREGIEETEVVGEASREEPELDLRSWHLGAIACFAEMAAVGVKRIGLSAAMSPEEMDSLIEEAEETAARNGAEIWRERDFLVTDLFSESLTEGKHVLLLYAGDTLQEYLDLKADKQRLIDRDAYTGEARREIARRMGRLLSYPEESIERMLSGAVPHDQ